MPGWHKAIIRFSWGTDGMDGHENWFHRGKNGTVWQVHFRKYTLGARAVWPFWECSPADTVDKGLSWLHVQSLEEHLADSL